MLEAETTLERICVDGSPDAQRFSKEVGSLVASVCAQGGGPVHAFGEMVALLAARGRMDAALRLESLWNDLAEQHRFSLYCAYPAAQFNSAEHMDAVVHICGAHSEVCPPETLAQEAGHPDSLALATWRLKALALEAEVERRKLAEEALHLREEELADFVENAAEGLHRVAGDGTILWANRAELDMLGYQREEYVGRHIAEFHADPVVITGFLAKLATGQTLYDEPAQLICKDGSIKNVLIHSNAYFQDGQLRYTRCFTRDVTDRLARQEAEAQRDSILMHAPVAAALLEGPDLKVTVANDQFNSLFGKAVAVDQRFEAAFPELAGSELAARLHTARRTGQAQTIDEWAFTRKSADGQDEVRWFSLSVQPLNGRRAAQSIVAIAHDMTGQVKARRILERSFIEREALLSELELANRAKDEFLAMLGHELRNPLSPIVTALQLMRMRGDTTTEREQQIIQRQVDHLIRLVDDLLDVSRVTRGMIELKQETVILAEVIAKSLEMASPLLEQREHHVQCNVEADLPWCGDPVRLAQVVANLLTNAARYTAPGGDIHIQAFGERDQVVILVKDNGIGLDPEVLPRIFDLFFQAGKSVNRAQGGLGIGLALVKSLVELHGGSVQAKSDGLGSGSEFVIRLPILPSVERQVEPCGSSDLSSAQAAKPKRILLVDDNEDGVELLGHLLRESGHDVRVTYDPAAALSVVERFAPDFAFVDIGLPVMDGYELVTRLRQRLGASTCRYIALSGYGQAADRTRSLEAGFWAHLVKPIDPNTLDAIIDAATDGRQSHDGSRSERGADTATL